MLAFANAKINLGLHVVEKRNDGFHNLETVFYPIKLYDVVEVTDAAELHFVAKGIDVPGDATENICLKAYELLCKDFPLPAQQITLLKNIPVGAGLGGGSADAAFLIKLLNQKFELSLSDVQMESYAGRLGADCPFFIRNSPVYATGIGDQFTDLDIDLSGYFIVLVKPDIHVSTADAYRGIKPLKTGTSLKDLISLPITEWKGNLRNDFEASVFVKFPEIGILKDQLYAAGAIFASMSGSGSSVFGIFEKAIDLSELKTRNQVFYHV